MKRSRDYASPSIIYVYKIRIHSADRKNERGELSTALLDSNVSHKLYKNERSKLGETKYFGRYDEEAFQQNLFFTTVPLPQNLCVPLKFKSLSTVHSLKVILRTDVSCVILV